MPSDPVELDLLRQWREPLTPRRLLRDSFVSIAIHVVLVAGFLSLPDTAPVHRAPIIEPDLHKAVHLVAPRYFEPTQKAPNKGKISRELDVRSLEPAPQKQARKFLPPAPAPGPVAPPSAPAITPVEQPKIEVAQAPPTPVITPATSQQQAPPPPPEKPKLAFENVGSQMPHVAPNPNTAVPSPKTSVLDGSRNFGPPGGGGSIVGDIGDSVLPVPGSSATPSSGRSGSTLQLLSDSKGVDFKPYLVQILVAVRRNWMAILPESARLGRRGRVLIQFAIDRNGAVPKVVIAEGAGTEAFDRAAVAAISASYPFPPLPADYKGDQIRLQFAFSYNMPVR